MPPPMPRSHASQRGPRVGRGPPAPPPEAPIDRSGDVMTPASIAAGGPLPSPGLRLRLRRLRQDLVLLHVVHDGVDERSDLALGSRARAEGRLRETGPDELVVRDVVEVGLDAVDLVLLHVPGRSLVGVAHRVVAVPALV